MGRLDSQKQAHLHFAIFGSPELKQEGKAIQLGTRKSLALLSYLAVKQQPLARSELDALLWPEQDDQRARRSLRDELSRLGKALGKDILFSKGQTLYLNSQALELDLWQFKAAMAMGDFEKAVVLYRGPLLAGFFVKDASDFEHWLEHERSYYQERYLFALEQLAQQAELRTDYTQALTYIKQSLETDPLSEKIYFQAMRMAALANERTTALKLFEDLKSVCAELGLTPDEASTQLFQRIAEGSFPKTVTSLEPKHNLPTSLTPLLGREDLILTIKHLLSRADLRLLSLTGPGGVGKTRLSLQVAREVLSDFVDGVYFVELAAVCDQEGLLAAIMKTLELTESQQSRLRSLQHALKSKRLLLILDNFEQLSQQALTLLELLKVCPQLKLLVSSRVKLQVRGEHEVKVPPLSLPDTHMSARDLVKFPVLELFKQRARAADSQFRLTEDNAKTVAQICRALDGLPLAIELAAVRTNLLSPEDLAQRLKSRLSFLTGGAHDLPERQQTLKATLEWSYEQLNHSEQRLLARLSIFAGSFNLEAAEAVCAEPGEVIFDQLSSLLDKSMLQRTLQDQMPRFSLLQTIREFAIVQLRPDDLPHLRERYAQYFVAFAKTAEARLSGADQDTWLRKLEAEHDNIRAVLTYLLEQENPEALFNLAASMWWFWFVQGYFQEGEAWLDAIVNKYPQLIYPVLQQQIFNALGVLTHDLGNYPKARMYLEQSLRVASELKLPTAIAGALNNLGLLARTQGHYAEAQTFFQESLTIHRNHANRRMIASSLNNLGIVAEYQESFDTAIELYKESLAIREALKDLRGIAMQHCSLGSCYIHLGSFDQAKAHLDQSLALQQQLGHIAGVGDVLNGLAEWAWAQGKLSLTHQYYFQSLKLHFETNLLQGTAVCLEGLAQVMLGIGKLKESAMLLGQSEMVRKSLDAPAIPWVRKRLDALREQLRMSLGQEDFVRASQLGSYLEIQDLLVQLKLESTEYPDLT